MSYTNSSLVTYTRLSPHNGGKRSHAIDRITPHHVVGYLSAEGIGAEFSGALQKSSNYGIGYDGKVGLYVPESDRSFCSSSYANDSRAVTIECANSPQYPYTLSETVYRRLIELCADICRRNGKKRLLWLENKDRILAYEPAPDEMVLTMHKFFISTQCPGEWLIQHMGDLAKQVTALLAKGEPAEQPQSPQNTDACEVELPFLRRGSRGAAVKSLQTLLIANNFSCGGYGADGDFGNATYTAVRNFQSARGLSIDGEVGPRTWSRLINGG